jgi:hypothetical protein
MDHMEESCVFYVKVALFDQLEQNIFCLLTVITFGIVMIPLQHDMMLQDSFMYDHGDSLKNQYYISRWLSNVISLSYNDEISAVVHHCVFL